MPAAEILHRNNSAARLHALFSKACPAKDKETARAVWARVLGMPGIIERTDRVQTTNLIRRLVLMANELDRVRAFAQSAALPPRLWANQLDSLQAALGLGSIEANWSPNRITPDALLALDWCAERMPAEEEIEIAEGELLKIRETVEDVWTIVADSALPAELRLELLRILNDLRDAIESARIVGPLDVRRRVVEAEATLQHLEPVLQPFEREPALSKLRALLDRVRQFGPYVASLARSMETVAKIADSGHKILKLVSGDPTPPTP